MLVDALNHKAIKLVPVIVRYFCPENIVKKQILDFSSLLEETVYLIYNKILNVLENFEIREKIINYRRQHKY